MTRGVNQIKLIFLAVLRRIVEFDGVRLDCNSSFSFEIHVIKELLGHVTNRNGLRQFKKTVGKGGLAVVNMRYYRKISYVVFFYCQNITSVTNLYKLKTGQAI